MSEFEIQCNPGNVFEELSEYAADNADSKMTVEHINTKADK